jgi:hypothetical protein
MKGQVERDLASQLKLSGIGIVPMKTHGLEARATTRLFRVSGARRRTGCGCFLLLGASSQTQSTGQNRYNHDRFHKFQSNSPPFPAGCSVCLGGEL